MSEFACLIGLRGAPVDTRAVDAMTAAFAAEPSPPVFSQGGSCAQLQSRSAFGTHAPSGPLLRGDVAFVGSVRLDNRPEVCPRLYDASHGDSWPDDGQVCLDAYARWGAACAEHLIGDYAFVIWDRSRQQVLAVRDALGIEPLHYARFGEQCVFASRVRPVLSHPRASRDFDEYVLAAWACGNPPASRSPYRDVQVLEPGNALTLMVDGEKRRRFWDLGSVNCAPGRSEDEIAYELGALLGRCVSDRLDESAPALGAELSGGMDSSTVCALAAPRCQETATRLVTTSLTFASVPEADESAYIADTVQHLGIESVLLPGAECGALDFPWRNSTAPDHPWTLRDPTIEAQLLALRERGARVMLTGNGGDEMLSASSYAYLDSLLRGDPRPALAMLRYVRSSGLSVLDNLYSLLVRPLLPVSARRWLHRARRPEVRRDPWPAWMNADAAKRLNLADHLYGETYDSPWTAARADRYRSIANGDYASVADTYRYTAARLGMDVRHPFADRRLAEFVYSLPESALAKGDHDKWPLRAAMRDRLPESVRLRVDKTQFGAVYGHDLASRRSRIDKALKHPLLSDMGLLDTNKLVDAFWHKHSVTGELDMSELYCVLSIQVWLHEHN